MFSLRFRWYALLTLIVAVAAAAPSSLRGQRAAQADSAGAPAGLTSAATPAPVGPRVPAGMWAPADTWARAVTLAPAATRAPADTLKAVLQQDDVSVGPNVALMGVGAAGLVVGLLVGGDAGMVIAGTSGVIGLVGLYRYLK